MEPFVPEAAASPPHRVRGLLVLALVALVGALGALGARTAVAEDDEADDTALAIARAVAPSFVRIEIRLRYDDGEAPNGFNAGGSYLQSLIQERRPWSMSGYVLAPDRVLMPDVQLHPRFIEEIRVVAGEQSTPARPVAWYRDNDAILLALDAPLEGVVPLQFDPTRAPPYYASYYGLYGTAWAVTVTKTFGRPYRYDDGVERFATWAGSVITDAEAGAVGIALNDEVRIDGSWRGSPESWDGYDRPAYEALLGQLEGWSTKGILHVHLRFRSPKQEESGGSPFFPMREGGEEAATDLYAPALLVDDATLLVLAELEPATTARLEAIEVLSRSEEPLPARFRASLKDYGALVADLDAPLDGALALSDRPIRSFEEQLLLLTRLDLQGERQTAYYEHARIHDFAMSWEQQVVVQAQGAGEGRYLFDPDGRLVAAPVLRRTPANERDRWRRPDPVMLPAVYLRAVLDDLGSNVDPDNVPLSADEENRLAWLGVELQPLNSELARLNDVSHLTRDGESGAIVAYVYPDSPAARAGIEAGDILVRIESPDRPTPIEVTAGHDPFSGFFEGMPDEIRDQIRGQMPGSQPWPSVDNALNRALTALGFGKPFTLLTVRDGEPRELAMTVEQGPEHYEDAARYESEALGLTVKDLTYEARRYFQFPADAPGVVIAKVESGRKAAVAGLLPFEIITHVDGVPMTSVEDLEAALEGEGELQFKVRHKLRERIVKIQR